MGNRDRKRNTQSNRNRIHPTELFLLRNIYSVIIKNLGILSEQFVMLLSSPRL